MLRIGLTSTRRPQGPKIFLGRLRESIERQRLARVMSFVWPVHDVDLFGSIARSVYGHPYVLRIDGMYPETGADSAAQHHANSRILRSRDRSIGVVYQSQFDCATFASVRACAVPSCVIANGAPLLDFRPDGDDRREALGIPRRARVLLTSAKWRTHKRLEPVVAAFLSLAARNADYHLVVLGDARDRCPAHPRLHTPGFVLPRDLPSWYRTGDVFVYLSWLDHCPNAVVEAIASGIPVVCTNRGGTRELVERARAGVVLEVDPPVDPTGVELERPPAVDAGLVAAAVELLFDERDRHQDRLDRAAVDIDAVAVRYVSFIQACLDGRGASRVGAAP